MSVPIEALPPAAAKASLALVDQLRTVLREDLVGAWLHGGTTFPDGPLKTGDLDFCAVVGRVAPNEREPAAWTADPGSRPGRLYAAQASVADACGVVFDTAFFLAEEMAGGEPPPEAFNRARPVLSWPIHRAHWLAGQYVALHGRPPEEMVTQPTRAELEYALDRELEHLERHVYEGDAASPYEATYAIWNSCRILYTLDTGSPVISKRSAGAWAIGHLPQQWHAAIGAAGRAYDGLADAADEALLEQAMAPFVEMARARLPATQSRPPGPPRWS